LDKISPHWEGQKLEEAEMRTLALLEAFYLKARCFNAVEARSPESKITAF
jgi:hypothetical protein